jgi:hypothetical protein
VDEGQVGGSGRLRQSLQDEAVRPPVRQFSLDAEDEDTVVANVDTERMLWLLYRVKVLNVLIEVFVLATEFRLPEAAAVETLGIARPLHTLVGDAGRRGCCCCSPRPCSLVSGGEKGDGGGDADFGCDGDGIGGFRLKTKFDTFATRAELAFEFECESDRALFRAASPALFPNESFHLLGFLVTVGMDVGTGTGGSEGTSGNDWTEAEAERVWRLSSRASVWDADASNSDVWM